MRAVRGFLEEHGGAGIMVIAKVECAEAVENIDEIIEAADGVMVARGDLGVEVPAYRVPHIQKEIVRACNRASKRHHRHADAGFDDPQPSAHARRGGDVANAIYDGTDAVMLSGETASGRYPLEAARMMARIAEASEAYLFEERPPDRHRVHARVDLAVGMAAVQTAENVGAACIVAPPCRAGPRGWCPTCARACHLRGHAVSPRHAPAAAELGVVPMIGDVQGDMQRVIEHARQTGQASGLVSPGDRAVFTAGDRTTSPLSGGGPDGAGAVAATTVMYVVQIRAEGRADAQAGAQASALD